MKLAHELIAVSGHFAGPAANVWEGRLHNGDRFHLRLAGHRARLGIGRTYALAQSDPGKVYMDIDNACPGRFDNPAQASEVFNVLHGRRSAKVG